MLILLLEKIFVVVYPLNSLLLGMLGGHLADAEPGALRLALVTG